MDWRKDGHHVFLWALGMALHFASYFLKMDIQLKISLWQIFSAIGVISSFFGWAAYKLVMLGRTWQTATTTLKELKTGIDGIKSEAVKTNDKTNDRISSIDARLSHLESIQTQFLTRMEILETLKRVEMMMINFMQNKVIDNIPDLTTAIYKKQQEVDAKIREGKQ